MPIAKPPRDTSKDYVDNKKFLKALMDYKEQKELSTKTGSPAPAIPEYIGDCIVRISTNLAFRPNFINYSFRDDMIGDGIENCMMYFDNFDSEKSENPFAYFSQICYYAFVRRIMRERKQSIIKDALINKDPNLLGGLVDTQDGDIRQYTSIQIERLREEYRKDKYQPKTKTKKRKRTQQREHVILTDFMFNEGDDERMDYDEENPDNE